MPRKLTGLTRRGNTYEVRFRVPSDIRATYKKREIVKSLGTTDESEARRRYFDTVKSINADFDKHRAEIGLSPLVPAIEPLDKPRFTQASRRRAANDYYAQRIDEERLRRHGLLKAAQRNPEAFWRGELIPALTEFASSRATFWSEAIVDGKLSIEGALYHVIAYTDAHRVEKLERAHLIGNCDEFLSLTDTDLDHADRVKLALDLMATEIRVLNALEIPSELVTMEQAETPPPAPVSTIPSPTPTQPTTCAPTFNVALKKWLNQNNGKRWTPERKISCEGILLDFCELAGERQIDQYTAAHGRTFKDALTVLPSSWRKRVPFFSA